LAWKNLGFIYYTNNSDILKEIVWIVVNWLEKGLKNKKRVEKGTAFFSTL
jgi:hypothetical protein